MAHHQEVHAARRNGSSNNQFVAGRSINVDLVLDLLVGGAAVHRHPSIRRASNALIADMARGRWRVAAGPHRGGRGGDQTDHVTVTFGPGRSFHLRLDRRGHLFQITDPSGRSAVDPWAAPGS